MALVNAFGAAVLLAAGFIGGIMLTALYFHELYGCRVMP